MKPRFLIVIILSVITIGTIIGYHGLKAAKSDDLKKSPQSSSEFNEADFESDIPESSYSSSSSLPDKEEVNKQGERRPVQYVHICYSRSGTIYVSQGTPKCLGNDQFQSDYDTSVPGTLYSSPCKTDSGKTRYVYIANGDECPEGTTLLFYNSLGGSAGGTNL